MTVLHLVLLVVLPLFATSDVPSIESFKKNFVRPASIPYPEDNKYSPEREELGKMLFFDPRLSRSNVMSCATCHNPSFSWGDGLGRGVGHGHKALGRRTPTILDLAWAERFFWDGRANSLEEQALGPIESPGEMNIKMTEVIDKISRLPGYQALFARAYPGEKINESTIGRAIATFERGVVSPEAPFDRWIKGEESAISPQAKRGFMLFNSKANCVTCHSGWSFTDHSFHDIGRRDNDLGRGKILPKLHVMQHAFKTPTLRNIDRRAPYMHDGSEKSLDSVVDFYSRPLTRRPSMSSEMKAIELNAEEKKDLVAFLKTLSGPIQPIALPQLPTPAP